MHWTIWRQQEETNDSCITPWARQKEDTKYLQNLKGISECKGASITEDYTISEKQINKKFSNKAREKKFTRSGKLKLCMKSSKNSNNLISIKAFHKCKGVIDCTELITTGTAYESQSYMPIDHNKTAGKHNKILPEKEKTSFKTWSFWTIDIQSGKEKDEGAKIYLITKKVAKSG